MLSSSGHFFEAASRRFVRFWALCIPLFVCGIVALNVLVDPYLIYGAPRIDGFNARKPRTEPQQYLTKTYESVRVAPRTVLLGNSRVLNGLRATYSGWPDQYRPIYNLGLGTGTPYVSLRYLQHVLSHGKVEYVFLGLDFEYFLNLFYTQTRSDSELESRLPGNRATARQRLADFAHSTLTLQALNDSLWTITRNMREGSYDMINGDLS